ncbi:MAG: endolytic transglycosylase MltG [Zetaproteobacteria bacterium CG_4_9_14_3_um_filter_49_83]|nr:MAG: ABC transporter substrate-binidng protein [Zetaproteobacteria bacterium CG1_02_49_23]PIQ30562.1 MAG: ABC transporter substrate-binidng protein [Zetaproteobacteria bacterium CG17_big_fil_post_rev_8_21_14_2_50_50_13]PIV31325.1 MAG: endolytic transglycosylase MltG [Zetaproteobacteria bacterium CG02_land_8_20_14_3_00_50_9]PIY55134.1 MAG: endolytic transglycosylase MltG [Zetaproteobacteria bacterium CG_4_10_14_0_8_um_filter_49_80]PJA35783.1 MAG: endolytic transglycosylase MltG [Zetaproteobac
MKALLISKWMLACVLLCLMLLAVSAGLFRQQLLQPRAVEAELTIAPGSSTRHISEQLQQAGVIDSALLFRLWVRYQGISSALKAGEYHLSGSMNMLDVLDKLIRGDVVMYRVTVPEGLRTDEIIQMLAKGTQTEAALWYQALATLLGSEEYEGRLLPETYTYEKPVKPLKVLKTMLQAQLDVLASIQTSTDVQKLRIIASIIEKETRLDHERVLVSAAIYNRLKKHMRLQMDPTVIYGIWRTTGTFSGNIRRKDLQQTTPWNTYTIDGLPPTPICHPGKASLMAAATPADVDYLYFVADGSGGHVFSSTLEDHQKHVQQWIRHERGL